MTSDFNSPPASPVRIVPIICRTTHTAEKNVKKLIDMTDECFQAIIPTPPLQKTVNPAQ